MASSRLLITAGTKHGALLLGDAEAREFRALAEGNFRGLCVSGTEAFAVTADGALYRVDPGRAKAEQIAELGWRECHDVRRIGEHFFLMATEANTIVRYDLAWREVDRWQLFPREEDVLHVNSIAADEEGLLVSLFCLTPGTRAEKRLDRVWKQDGRIVRLDWATGRWHPISQPLGQPHSLTAADGRVLLCNSFHREVSEVDRATGRVRRLAATPGWCRGITWRAGPTGGEWLVGISANRRRKLRWQGRRGQVAAFAADWRPLWHVPAPAAEIYDLVVVSGEW